ncbi:MAG: YbaB/EbfC family nucleoid-associated protein [Planctomycetaceae bacterium]|nr:YbaB/EbfC family nucleoid-associated protein [Planctomycetaceae bacterium]
MFQGLAQMARLLSNPQELKDQAQDMKSRLAEMRLQGEAAEGRVQVEASGDHRILSVRIDDALMNADREIMEGHILSACNSALEKAREATARELSQLTSGLGLPGLDKFLG